MILAFNKYWVKRNAKRNAENIESSTSRLYIFIYLFIKATATPPR